MNIELFIATRKAKNYSQQALCDGICTQATLSRFENNGKIPSVKILVQLCKRLDLELDELFGTDNEKVCLKGDEIKQAEFSLIVEDYDQIQRILSEIDVKEIKDNDDVVMQYYYLRGYLEILGLNNISESIFDFNQILTELDKDNKTIYTSLAWAGLGIAYWKDSDLKKSEYYFSKVFDNIYKVDLSESTDIWRYINIVFRCATYYSGIKEFNTSNELISYGLKICQENHVTYYTARLEAVKTRNFIAQNKPVEQIKKSLNEARVFAEFNNNQNLLTQLSKLEYEYLD